MSHSPASLEAYCTFQTIPVIDPNAIFSSPTVLQMTNVGWVQGHNLTGISVPPVLFKRRNEIQVELRHVDKRGSQQLQSREYKNTQIYDERSFLVSDGSSKPWIIQSAGAYEILDEKDGIMTARKVGHMQVARLSSSFLMPFMLSTLDNPYQPFVYPPTYMIVRQYDANGYPLNDWYATHWHSVIENNVPV